VNAAAFYLHAFFSPLFVRIFASVLSALLHFRYSWGFCNGSKQQKNQALREYEGTWSETVSCDNEELWYQEGTTPKHTVSDGMPHMAKQTARAEEIW
jgi:hypothetical protein